MRFFKILFNMGEVFKIVFSMDWFVFNVSVDQFVVHKVLQTPSASFVLPLCQLFAFRIQLFLFSLRRDPPLQWATMDEELKVLSTEVLELTN